MSDLRNGLISSLGLENEIASIYTADTDSTMVESVRELNDTYDVINESVERLDDIADSEVTLESLISVIEEQSQFGQINETTVKFANIGLESVATRFNINKSELMISFEDDSATTGKGGKIIDNIKKVLAKMASAIYGLLIKLFNFVTKFLMSSEMMVKRISNRAAKIKQSLSHGETSGSVNVMEKNHSINGKALSTSQYIKELDRLVTDTNTINNVYTNDGVMAFTRQVLLMSQGKSDKSLSSVTEFTKKLSFNCNKKTETVHSNVLFDSYVSDYYLGGIRCIEITPSERIIKDIKTGNRKEIRETTVSKPRDIPTKVLKIAGGGFLFYNSIGGVIGSAVLISTGILPVLGVLAMAIHLTIGRWGLRHLAEGMSDTDEARVNVDENNYRWITTSYVVEKSKSSNKINVDPLSYNQCKDVCDIVIKLKDAAPSLSKSSNSMGKVNQDMSNIVKEIAGMNNEYGARVVGASTGFIREWLTNAAKYQTDLINNVLKVADSALDYVEKSNRG